MLIEPLRRASVGKRSSRKVCRALPDGQIEDLAVETRWTEEATDDLLVEFESIRDDQGKMLEIHPSRKVAKQSVSVPVASPSRHRRWPEPRPDFDCNEDPTRCLLVARERANLVGLKLFGSEASDPSVIESTTHLGCLLEPAGDGVPGNPFDPGNRGNADTLDSESDDRRCCTALAESEIRLWWWPRYVSSMKYPKRCQYKHAKQKKYHVRNWAEYNEGLRRRGDLTVWFDEEAIANWKADKTGKPGGQRVYSDMAIETGLVVRMVYKLAYRQTEGFLHSIASLLGLGIEIPDYSTLCRRSRLLRKKLRIPKAASTQPIHLMIDSTGLRIHVGNARKPPKQRAWRKLHIAVDRETGNIVASELTASRARDATRVPALLTQIQAPLVSVAADSAYDKEAVYEAIEAHSPGRRTRVVIPPQRNATLSQNSNTAMQERDRHIRAIERHGRREWYKLSGYTKRSMVENAVYRYKAIIGPEMRARTLARQRVEHRIGCEILNKMAALGMPDTYCAG